MIVQIGAPVFVEVNSSGIGAALTTNQSTADLVSDANSARVSADASLTVRISIEESVRAAADASLLAGSGSGGGFDAASLTSRVSGEETARASGDASLTTLAASLTTRVSGEEVARASADTSLTTRVSTADSARASGDASIVVVTGSLATASTAESSLRTSADLSLTTRTSAEESTRAAADTSLTSSVSVADSIRVSADASLTVVDTAEASSRVSGDLSLTTRTSAEEVARASGDTSLTALATSLTARTSGEESTRASGDTSLTTRVSSEESARASGDVSLTTLTTSLTTADASLATVRSAADASLAVQISTELSVRASADASLTTRVSSEESARAANSVTAAAAYLPYSGGTLTGALTLSSDPTTNLQPATKQYVDGLVTGLSLKVAAKAATTVAGGNITLSGAQTIDGVSVVAGDRVLVKNQTSVPTNGIYICAAGAWTRSTDADAWAELVSAFVFVEQGTANANSGWTCNVVSGGTLGTTDVTWVQFSASTSDSAPRISADTSLTSRISSEESARASGDASLTATVSTANSTRTSGDTSLAVLTTSLTTASTAEASLRTSADLSLTTRTSSEESTRASADTSLSTRISTADSARVSGDASVVVVTTSLATASTTEASLRTSADLSLTTRTSGEESTRASADTSLTTRVSAAESVRTSGDTSLATLTTSLTTRVSGEESARASGDTSLTTLTTSLTARVSGEENSRASADTSIVVLTTSLTTRVSTEEVARASGDTSLTTLTTSLATASTAEASLRTSADTSLATLTTSLATASTAEASLRISADTSLTSRVSTEEATRSTADASLTTRVSTADSARVSADASIVTALAASGGTALVNFLQSGTGATSRTTQSKFREYISIKDFGAVGDGTTNDAPAINAALQASLTALAGRGVYVPGSGANYLCGATIVVPTGAFLYGDGPRASSRLKKGFNGTFVTLDDGAGLQGLSLDGNGATYTGTGIEHIGGNQTVRDTRIFDTESTAVYFTTSTGANCHYENVTAYVYGSTSGSGKYAFKIQDLGSPVGGTPRHFVNIKTSGVESFDFGAGNNVLISASALYDLKWSTSSRNVAIVGCRIASTAQLNIYGSGSIVGCDLGSKASLKSGSVYCLGPNIYNNSWEDVSGAGDNLVYSIDEISYTPVCSAGGTPITLGNGTLVGSYSREGRTLTVTIRLLPGSTTTFGASRLSFTLPQVTSSAFVQSGVQGRFEATSGDLYRVNGYIAAGGTEVLLERDTTGAVTSSSPGTMAVTGGLTMTVVYDV